MEVFLIKATQLILAFAILVIIHEFGHFLFARLFGVKVERFYIFFNPRFSIFKWKPKEYSRFFSKNTPFDSEHSESSENTENPESSEHSDRINLSKSPAPSENSASSENSKKRGFWSDTEYGIGWLPLGGYCKIAGMVDESMDLKQLERAPEKWEFRSKPAWQRLLIMIAGVLFNFLLAIIIYAGIVYATGEKYVPISEARMGMNFTTEAKKAGFHDGDLPIRADGEALEHDPQQAMMQLLQAHNADVLRDGDTVRLDLPSDFIFRLEQEAKESNEPFRFMTYRIPAEISQVVAGEGAAKAGLAAGDRIVAIGDTATPDLLSFLKTLEGHADQTVPMTVVRNAKSDAPDTLRVPVALNSSSKMGIGLEVNPSAFFKADEKHYTLLSSVPRGIQMGTDRLTSYAKSMKLVFTKEGAKSVGGFGSIGSIFPESWDWIAFWNIAAFLSVALAFMNIIPIPGLDGGHVLFLLYEVIFRRPPNQKFQERATMVGFALLILLLLYANGMDIVRLFIK